MLLRQAAAAVLCALALSAPALGASSHEYADYPREIMGLPSSDHRARLCAERLLEGQVAFMQELGWPVEMPMLRTGDAPVRGAFAATFPWAGGWWVVLSPDTERAWCRTLTRLRAGLTVDRMKYFEVGFHEPLHQVLPTHDEIYPMQRRLARTFLMARA